MKYKNIINPKYFYFTIDVDWIPGSEVGLKLLFDLCDKYSLNATLFVAGRFAENYSELVKEASRRGYELGTHGWEHGFNSAENFQTSSYEEQKRWLILSTDAVEKASGRRAVAFRAPFLRISEISFKIMAEQQYQLDSSIPARRLQPAKRYHPGYRAESSARFFWAPLEPYYPSTSNIGIRGSSPILEIAPSAFFIPINLKAIRYFGLKAISMAVRLISRISPVLVFYLHPYELVKPDDLYLPSDANINLKRIGPENYFLLERFVDWVLSLGYRSSVISKPFMQHGKP
jgi:peptidoglycan/xylan/chitin deacetylase (PgdA/CDA1 family)